MTTRVRPSRTTELGLSIAERTDRLVPGRHGGPVPGSLPAELTRLVGRDAEVAELTDLLARTRLLTLAGPGGAGKSRLALALAGQREHQFDGGVWWMDLGAVEEGAIDHMLLSTRSARTSIGELVSYLPAASATLLVLDNCEHVAEASARLVSELLAVRPELRIVARRAVPSGFPASSYGAWRGWRCRRHSGTTAPTHRAASMRRRRWSCSSSAPGRSRHRSR